MTQVEFLDVEMGIDEGNLKIPNWITRFKNTNLVKWVILQGKFIQKRCVHFPLILILCLLYSDAYPNILFVSDSLIISSVITFITCLKGLLYSPSVERTKNFSEKSDDEYHA